MNYDDNWPDNTLEIRREMILKTIRPAPVEELKQLSEVLFPVASDPWAERFNAYLAEHAHAKFYLAEVPGARIAYCRDAGKGFWFIPGTGVGIIQPRGLQALAEIVDKL